MVLSILLCDVVPTDLNNVVVAAGENCGSDLEAVSCTSERSFEGGPELDRERLQLDASMLGPALIDDSSGVTLGAGLTESITSLPACGTLGMAMQTATQMSIP
jgi:hypothetical protein